LDELKNYFFVGGMPESVKAYVETRSMQEAFATQRDLIDSFRHDFAKYSPKVNSRCLEAVLAGVAGGVGTQVIYTHLAEGFTQPTIKRAFDTLRMGRIITRVPSASPAGLPLGATVSSRKLKAILVDIGLWQSICGVNVAAEYHKSDLLSIYRGAMAEQFVGQEMMLSQNSNLYYWARQARGSIAEVDYLAVVDGSIVPIEVKSGAAGRLRSLHLLLQSYPRIPFGVVFSSRPYSELQDQRLKFIPIYYACSSTGGTM
jgi:predicted AAA+ superfamily ATPase